MIHKILQLFKRTRPEPRSDLDLIVEKHLRRMEVQMMRMTTRLPERDYIEPWLIRARGRDDHWKFCQAADAIEAALASNAPQPAWATKLFQVFKVEHEHWMEFEAELVAVDIECIEELRVAAKEIAESAALKANWPTDSSNKVN